MATSFWVRCTGTTSNMPIHGRHLNDIDASSGFYICFVGAAANLALACKAGASFVISGFGTATVRDGNWHNICLNYRQGSGQAVELFVDGALDYTQTAGSAHGGASYPVRFGSVQGTFFPAFTGEVAEMAVWSAELTTGEVAALAKGFRPPNVKQAGLLNYISGVRAIQDIRGGTLATSGASVSAHPRTY